MTDYAIGDIHGCITELEALLDKVQFDPSRDVLWSVGDLVGRGPHSRDVLHFVRRLGRSFRCVLGNHDLHLLAVLSGAREPHPKDNTEAVIAATDASEWLDWLRQQPLMITDTLRNRCMVHAGIYPQWTHSYAQQRADEAAAILQGPDYKHYLQQMYHSEPSVWSEQLTGVERFRFIVNAFTRMRYLYAESDSDSHTRDAVTAQPLHLDFACKLGPAEAPAHLMPWFKYYPQSPIQTVFGHWAALQGQTDRTDIIGLDTGCVWGKSLTLLNFSTQSLTQEVAHTDIR